MATRSRSPHRRRAFDGGGGDFAEALERFLLENAVDENASAKLREQPHAIQLVVVEEGPISGRNTSAILMGRIRRATSGGGAAAAAAVPLAFRAATPGAPPPPQTPPPMMVAAAFAAGHVQEMVRAFVAENDLDAAAAQNLVEQRPDIIEAVISQGPLTGRNSSAILISRIRRAMEGTRGAPAPPTQPHPAFGGFGGAPAPMMQMMPRHAGPYGFTPALGPGGFLPPGQPPPPTHAPRSLSPVMRFVVENQLDPMAEARLREQPPAVQRAVISEGVLTGRNLSAVLAGRIRRVLENGTAQEDPIADFIRENKLDEGAARVLLEAPVEVQSKVIEEGAITGRNPNAIVLSRLRRLGFVANEQPQRPAHHPPPMGMPPMGMPPMGMPPMGMPPMGMPPMHGQGLQLPAGNVMAGQGRPLPQMARSAQMLLKPKLPLDVFCDEHGLDNAARQLLRSQPEEVQRAVMHEGPLTGRNAAAVLASRIRRVTSQGSEEMRQDQPPPPMNAAPFEATVLHFVDEIQGLDEQARTLFLEQPPEIQEAVMQEGYITGRNPSAVLASRIRRVAAGQPPGDNFVQIHRGLPGQPPPPSQPPPPGHPPPMGDPAGAWRGALPSPTPLAGWPQRSLSPVSQFAEENNLDVRAVQSLREQPPGVVMQVISEGSLTGRNPNAVLSGRIRRVLETQASAQASEDFVAAFARQHGLDEQAVLKLREAPLDVQQQVVEEGPLTGRNPNACMLSRLKRVQASRT